MRWEQISGVRGFLAVFIGTAGGAGFFPLAPGTMGTLVAVPLAFYTASWDWSFRLALWVGLTLIGTWSAKVFDETMGTSDNQHIVIDEVVGYGITSWTCGTGAVPLLVAFVLFRAFDIIKPPPVRQLDRWSKIKASSKSEIGRWWGGFGVIGDDIVAGFQALLVIIALQHFGILS